MDAEVTRRIVDVIFHRQRGAESDNSMRDESTEALSDFVFELLLDSKWFVNSLGLVLAVNG